MAIVKLNPAGNYDLLKGDLLFNRRIRDERAATATDANTGRAIHLISLVGMLYRRGSDQASAATERVVRSPEYIEAERRFKAIIDEGNLSRLI